MKNAMMTFLYQRPYNPSANSIRSRTNELQNFSDKLEKLIFQKDFLKANDLPESALNNFSEQKEFLFGKALTDITIARIMLNTPKISAILKSTDIFELMRAHLPLAEECLADPKGRTFLASLEPLALFNFFQPHESIACTVLNTPEILACLGGNLTLELIGSHLPIAEKYLNHLDENEMAFLNSGNANLFGLCRYHEHIALRILNSPFGNKLTTFELTKLGKIHPAVKRKIFEAPALYQQLSCSQLAQLCKNSDEFYNKLKTFPLQAHNSLSHFKSSDLGKLGEHLSSIAIDIINQPQLFEKLTPDDLSKLGCTDEAIAMKIVCDEYRPVRPRPNRLSSVSNDYELNNNNLIKLAEKYFSVASYIIDTSNLRNKLNYSNLNKLKKCYETNRKFVSTIDQIENRKREREREESPLSLPSAKRFRF